MPPAGDAAEAKRTRACYHDARDAYTENGYPPYRATSMSMPNAMDTNPVAREFLATMKGAVDPANVLAPGRCGTPKWQPADTPPQ